MPMSDYRDVHTRLMRAAFVQSQRRRDAKAAAAALEENRALYYAAYQEHLRKKMKRNL